MKFISTLFLLFSFLSIQAQTDSTQIPKNDSGIYYKPEMEASYPGGIERDTNTCPEPWCIRVQLKTIIYRGEYIFNL